MLVPNKNIRKTILNMVNSSGAAHIAAAYSVVEILNTIYNNVNISKIKNSDILLRFDQKDNIFLVLDEKKLYFVEIDWENIVFCCGMKEHIIFLYFVQLG